MTPETKAAWIAELRSGRYEQARNSYADGDGKCCLTVLAVTQRPDKFYTTEMQLMVGDRPATDYDLIDEFGLTWTQVAEAITMNDGEMLNFERIADRVEEWR
jgi:hypothetical protein